MATQYGASSGAMRAFSLRSLLAAGAYRATSLRDQRFDLLRGFCLFAMIVDHVGGKSWLHALSGGNSFFVSAAEGFVFISGLLVGLIYHRVLDREGLAAAALKALRRARTLYLLMVALTLVFFYGGWAAGAWWADPAELADVPAFVFSVATFHRSFYITDVLMLYTLLLAAAPAALWLLHSRRTALLLAISWAVWLGFQFVPLDGGQPDVGLRTFNPLAWQILFVHAMALGYHRERVARFFDARRRRWLFVVCGSLFVALVVLYNAGTGWIAGLAGRRAAELFDAGMLKDTVRPGRLLAASVVFPFAYMLVSYLWEPIRRAFGWLLLPLGENSLYSYTMHTMLILLAAALLGDQQAASDGQLFVNTLVDAGAVLAIWLLIRRRVLFSVIPR